MTFAPTASLPLSMPGRITTVRWQIRRVMSRGGVWTLPCVINQLRPVWEDELPTDEWLNAVISDDRVLRQVAVGRWVHAGAALDGRIFTRLLSAAEQVHGIIAATPELTTPLVRYEGWRIIPVSSHLGHSLMQRVTGRSGQELLVTSPRVIPSGGPLLGIIPGPEGLYLQAVSPDPSATSRLHRRLREAGRRCTVDPKTSGIVVADPLEELAALASDPTLRQAPTAPFQDLSA